jgi:hypothetical protein
MDSGGASGVSNASAQRPPRWDEKSMAAVMMCWRLSRRGWGATPGSLGLSRQRFARRVEGMRVIEQELILVCEPILAHSL